jgi:glycosidase
MTHSPWRSAAATYELYVQSFADSDGNGIGDLAGVRARLPYLAEPGIVPNHCSDQHRWFAAALAAPPGSAERARFWFRPGRGEHGDLAARRRQVRPVPAPRRAAHRVQLPVPVLPLGRREPARGDRRHAGLLRRRGRPRHLGPVYLYQGEELGLWEVEDLPWLPQPPAWHALTVEAESAGPESMLSLYRHALRLRRRELPPAAPMTWLPSAPGVLSFTRGFLACIASLSPAPVPSLRATSSSPAPRPPLPGVPD